MPAGGGEIQRLTYLASQSLVVGWRDEKTILFSSTAFEGQRATSIAQVAVAGGLSQPLRLGPAAHLAFSPKGEVLLERNSTRPDPAHWKRYRGGTAGRLWLAPHLDSEFKPLLSMESNFSCPMFAGDRIYFLSDHEGIGNLYSCLRDSSDLRRETSHKEYYARNASTDGQKVVYHCGGDLYVYDIADRKSNRVEIDYRSQRTQRQRKFVPTHSFLDCAMPDPKGEAVAITARGQIHTLRNWDGPVETIKQAGVRYRLAQYTHDGTKLISVNDQNGEEELCIYDLKTRTEERLGDPAWGRFVDLLASPKTNAAAFSNHRNEIWWIDFGTRQATRLAQDAHNVTREFNWSPDGRWLAFSLSEAWNRMHICIAELETGKVHKVTNPIFEDFGPNFDPEGRYLYFLSKRELNPVYDGMQFELSFPKGVIPCLLTLRKDVTSPFLAASDDPKPESPEKKDEKKDVKLEIDFDGIEDRTIAFPMPEAKYARVAGLGKKVLFLSFPVEPALNLDFFAKDPPAKGILEVYDFSQLKSDIIVSGVSDFAVSLDRSQMLLRIVNRVRLLKAGEKPDDSASAFNKKHGWIDIDRAKTLVEPTAEWRQMLHEVWRLQRDHFWREDMSKINWKQALNRYRPLLDRISCRSEFGDLVWELQGELGTSHAYDFGGDYRVDPYYPVGLLGAEFSLDEKTGGYRVERLLEGDSWKPAEACPLSAPGVGIRVGDTLLAINGEKLSAEITPHRALLHQAGLDVELTFVNAKKETKRARVRTLHHELTIRYRDWIRRNQNTFAAKRAAGSATFIFPTCKREASRNFTDTSCVTTTVTP